jgi:hypothetical protein
VGDQGREWFIALLNRLRELCREKVDRFFQDYTFQDQIRFHEVDWSAASIPIQRTDLLGLPTNIRTNDEDYPIFQFHLSKGTGRIHGFWDTNYCFQVILLDPFHNLQPSKAVQYEVRPTVFGRCEYSLLKTAVDEANEQNCIGTECPLAKQLREVHRRSEEQKTVVIARITSDVAKELSDLRAQGNETSISEIVSFGISFFEEKKS